MVTNYADDGHGDEDERVKSRMVMITVQRTTKAVTGMKTQIYISSEEKFNAKRCGTQQREHTSEQIKSLDTMPVLKQQPERKQSSQLLESRKCCDAFMQFA
jgi:hypothetical protein